MIFGFETGIHYSNINDGFGPCTNFVQKSHMEIHQPEADFEAATIAG